jgi:hypothetical protein
MLIQQSSSGTDDGRFADALDGAAATVPNA